MHKKEFSQKPRTKHLAQMKRHC